MLFCLGSAHAESISLEGWRTLLRDAQRQVTTSSPTAPVALRRLADRRVRDPEGGIIEVDDGVLQRLTLAADSLPDDDASRRATALHLALLESEADQLLRAPPPPYARAIRPDGALFPTTTRPLPPASEDSSLQPSLEAGWSRVRAWVGLAITGRGSGPLGVPSTVLLLVSLVFLLLVVWPALSRALPGGQVAAQSATGDAAPRHSPLGERLLRLLARLEGEGLLRRARLLTNGEVLQRLPLPFGRALRPALEAHDRACYGSLSEQSADDQALERADAALQELL